MTKNDWSTTACLYCWSTYYKESTLTDVTVTVGRKYVTLKDGRCRRFSIEDGQEVSDYTTYHRLFPSRAMAEQYIHQQKIQNCLRKYLTYDGARIANKRPIDEQEKLLKFFEGETE